MIRSRSASTAVALPLLLALAGSPALAQQDAASAPSAAQGNKAGKPPTDAAANESGVATKKPAKPGAQSGPASPEADAAKAKGNKAGKPSVDDAAARSEVANKKPAKQGSQSGPAPAASAP